MITRLARAFRRYDEQNAPLGLYAISEARGLAHPDPENWGDWNLIIKPILERQAYRINLPEGEFQLCTPFNRPLNIHLLRLSKIKVRRYGNTHRVDPHLDYSARWEVARMQTRARALSKIPRGDRLLILVGFAREDRPFHNELEEFKQTAGASTLERATQSLAAWPDPHRRGFYTLVAIWQWRE
jgi:hypothetical protein